MAESVEKLSFDQRISRRGVLRMAMRLAIGTSGLLASQNQLAHASPTDEFTFSYDVSAYGGPGTDRYDRLNKKSTTTKTNSKTTIAPINKSSATNNTPANKAVSSAYEIPSFLSIPAIRLSVPIQTVGIIYRAGGAEWGSPAWRAAGWHNTSSRLGEPGNLVLNGHNNIYGSVFAGLYNLKPGNEVIIRAKTKETVYTLSHYLLLREVGQPISVLMDNAKHILPTGDTRLTMVTCWPLTNNTHRWIWIGYPSATRAI
jgi:sortase (surface protein transpeptidase)